MHKSGICCAGTGEKAVKKGVPTLKWAGFKSVEDLPRTAVGIFSKAYQDSNLPPPQLRLSTTSNGEQRVRVRVPNVQALHFSSLCLMQEYRLDGPQATINREKVQSECQEIRVLPNGVGRLD